MFSLEIRFLQVEGCLSVTAGREIGTRDDKSGPYMTDSSGILLKRQYVILNTIWFVCFDTAALYFIACV